MKKRTFSELQKSKSRKEFYKFIKEFAEFYATSGADNHYMIANYQVTESCYYKILEASIRWNIIDDETAKILEDKVKQNSSKHGGNIFRTQKKYEKLREEREEYKKFPFTKEEAIRIAVQLTEDEDITKKDLAEWYCVAVKDIDKALYLDCVNNWIEDILFFKLKEQSIAARNEKRTIDFFNELEKMRKANKE